MLTTEAEIRVIQPQATRSWRRKKQNKTVSPLEPLEADLQPCVHLNFRLLDSKTAREQIHAALSHKFVVICYRSHSPFKCHPSVYTHYSIT